MKFNPNHSRLETDPKAFEQYFAIVQNALGPDRTIVGAIEIGSYAKGEAVPGSDIDTRVYVTAPDVYLRQTVGRHSQTKSRMDIKEQAYARLQQERGWLPIENRTWEDFSQPLSEELLRKMGYPIDIGFADARFVDYMFTQPGQAAIPDFDLIPQCNVLYDPQGIISGWRETIRGLKCSELEKYYRSRFLDALPFEIYENLEPHEMDSYKLKNGGQIQWVKWAVRSLRDAVATNTWIETGTFVYRKEEVLDWYARNLPDRCEFVQKVYRLKTDPVEREQLSRRFLANPKECFEYFKSLMPELELTVRRVKEN